MDLCINHHELTKMNNQLIKDLLDLEGSTTYLLEFVFGSKLKVDVISQYEKRMLQSVYLERAVRLYFHSAESPQMYCVSYFDVKKLKQEEKTLLMENKLPVGKLFLQLNPGEYIKKTNLKVGYLQDAYLIPELEVSDSPIYRKTYDYWIGERKVGFIEENFSKESFNRAHLIEKL